MTSIISLDNLKKNKVKNPHRCLGSLSVQDFCALIPSPVFVFDIHTHRLSWSNYLAKEMLPYISLGISYENYKKIINSTHIKDVKVDSPFNDSMIIKAIKN